MTLNSNLSPPGKSQQSQEPPGNLWKAELSFLSFSRGQLTSCRENRPNVRCRTVASSRRAQTEQQRPPWPRGSLSLNKHSVLNSLTTSQSHSLAPQTLTESLIHRPNKALSLFLSSFSSLVPDFPSATQSSGVEILNYITPRLQPTTHNQTFVIKINVRPPSRDHFHLLS